MRRLIKGGTVLPMEDGSAILPGGEVLIEHDRILAIGHALDAAGAEVIDAQGGLVMPGLVNAHLHSWQTAMRGIGGDWAGTDYFRIAHGAIAPRYRPEDLRIGTLVGALAQLEAGVTTLFDWCHGNATPEHTDAALDGLMQSGLRAVFGHGTVKPKPKPGETHFSQVPHPAAEIRRLRRGPLASDDALVTLAACILGPDYSTLEVCRADFALAREYGLLSSAHVWGNSNRLVQGGYRTIAAEGLLGPDHNLVHGTYIDDDELRIIVDSGASVTSTAAAELKSDVREPLSCRVARMGGRPSIAPDSEVLNGGSMLDCMRFALQAHRIFNNNHEVARSSAAPRPLEVATPGSPIQTITLRHETVLHWATLNNARALRMDHRIGSLVPGKLADIIVIGRDSLGMIGARDPAQAVIQFASPADVRMVMVGGRILKQDGQLLHPGLAALKARLLESAGYLLKGIEGVA
ncbi:amidohydrolase family protein [Pseudoroseomonas globiformis]|uniref:Amidohydrolase family protein n=1 Tax=Teichococcus globiformis TaxID=2307229 RepID=A0ABV7G3T8_9PROT